MATIITNQAQVNFSYGSQTGSAASNIATTTLQDPFTVSKNSLETTYRQGQQITYILAMNNSGAAALTNVVIVDNLGTQSFGSINVTPLDYTGPARLYINGVFVSTLTPVVGADTVTFTIAALPAQSNAMIIYAATVNSFAGLAPGSQITNQSTWTATGLTERATASNVIAVDAYADVRITKAMSPNPVITGSRLTYSFIMYNYGNTPAANAVLTDTFTPPPSSIAVQVNGTAIPATEFTFLAGTLTLPSSGSAFVLSIPAATFTRNPSTGIVTVSPGTTTVEVTGII